MQEPYALSRDFYTGSLSQSSPGKFSLKCLCYSNKSEKALYLRSPCKLSLPKSCLSRPVPLEARASRYKVSRQLCKPCQKSHHTTAGAVSHAQSDEMSAQARSKYSPRHIERDLTRTTSLNWQEGCASQGRFSRNAAHAIINEHGKCENWHSTYRL